MRNETTRTFFSELARYFGFPLFAVVVVVIAFFATNRQIEAEIHNGTFQILQDSSRTQRNELERYIDRLTTRINLIAVHDSELGPAAICAALRDEMRGIATDVRVGYASKNGLLLFGENNGIIVRNEDWFNKSIGGKSAVVTASFDEDGGPANLRISTRVQPENGSTGVLFATLGGDNFAKLLDTQAYQGAAFSAVIDSEGTVLFTEGKESLLISGASVFDVVNDQTLDPEYSIAELKNELGDNKIIETHFTYDAESYHAVSIKVHVSDWYVVTFVPGSAADYIQRQVSIYQLGMLFIMLVVGISLSIQSYLHERATIQKLENDKDLLQQSAQRYQLITRLSNEVFFYIDLQTGNVSFNENFEIMFGFPPPVCSIGDTSGCISLFKEEDRACFETVVKGLLDGATEAIEEVRMIDAHGLARWKRIEIFAVFGQDGKAVEFVGKIADIHHQKKSMQKLIRQADSDPLTRLLNRGALERSVKTFLSGEGKQGRHALLFLDFDRFKQVNDTLGHAIGDELLVDFAEGMRRLFRAGDFLSRTGGDEYVVFVKNIAQDDVAYEKATALGEEMEQLSRKVGLPVSVSVGIAIYDRDGETFEQLYKAADKALYRVKQQGKNAIAFYSEPEKTGPDEI